jgi:hypothetical protein
MVHTTRAQRESLFRLFRRDFPSWETLFRTLVLGQVVCTNWTIFSTT